MQAFFYSLSIKEQCDMTENNTNFSNSNDNQLSSSNDNQLNSSNVNQLSSSSDSQLSNSNDSQLSNSNDNQQKPQNTYSFWAEQIGQNQNASNFSPQNRETNNNNEQTFYLPNFNANQGSQNSYNIPPANDNPPEKKKSKAGKVAGFLLKAASFGVVASLTFLGCNALYRNYDDSNSKGNRTSVNSNGLYLDPVSKENKLASTTISQNVAIQSTDVSDIVEQTMPATVAITSTMNQTINFWGQDYGQEVSGGGSGIIIGKTDKELLIATNNHVVADATKILVTFIDDSTAEATIKGRNSSADLAVISIDVSKLEKDTLDKIKVAKIGNSDDIKVGQMAIAIGNALGYGQTVTVGYISAKEREITVDTGNTLEVLQTDAAINPGNSGGALINIKGEVIGINSAKLAKTNVEGMGYAIPISKAFPIVDELMNREVLTDNEKGYLGVYPQDVNEEYAKAYNWPVGAYVSKLVDGGAAEKAGIYQGDIITAVNGATVKTGDELRETVTSYRYGTTVKITLMRLINGEYKEMNVDVVLQANTSDNKTNTPTDAPTDKNEGTPDITVVPQP
jgi:serine protease Do